MKPISQMLHLVGVSRPLRNWLRGCIFKENVRVGRHLLAAAAVPLNPQDALEVMLVNHTILAGVSM